MSPIAQPPAEVWGFPEFVLQPSQLLFRIHPSIYKPWWFSSGGTGRFHLDPPKGACYLAEEERGAFVEAFQDWMGAILPAVEVLTRRISTLSTPLPVRLADCTKPRALAFGVTGEIHASPDRTRTQAWAKAFDRAGFDGIRFLVRHDPAQQHVGVALFGAGGEVDWPITSTGFITAELMLEVEKQFGIRIR